MHPTNAIRTTRPVAKLAQPTRQQPARLPQATAELVNRLLAARCGGAAR